MAEDEKRILEMDHYEHGVVLNPGSCGYFGGSAGLIEVSGGMIVCCRILRQSDLEDEK